MTTYTVTFHASHSYAVEDIEAKSLKHALKKAHALYDRDVIALNWSPYDPDCKPLRAIDIESMDGTDGTIWQSEDLALECAAPDLAEALTDLLDQIDSLTGESSCIDEDIKQGEEYRAARAAIAKAKGGLAMSNTNCLEHIRCPTCGSEDAFRVSARIWIFVTDDGTEDEGGHYEWDNDSPCQCADCDRLGTIKDFRTDIPKGRVVCAQATRESVPCSTRGA
jgi:hypothetical protein